MAENSSAIRRGVRFPVRISLRPRDECDVLECSLYCGIVHVLINTLRVCLSALSSRLQCNTGLETQGSRILESLVGSIGMVLRIVKPYILRGGHRSFQAS